MGRASIALVCVSLAACGRTQGADCGSGGTEFYGICFFYRGRGISDSSLVEAIALLDSSMADLGVDAAVGDMRGLRTNLYFGTPDEVRAHCGADNDILYGCQVEDKPWELWVAEHITSDPVTNCYNTYETVAHELLHRVSDVVLRADPYIDAEHMTPHLWINWARSLEPDGALDDQTVQWQTMVRITDYCQLVYGEP